MPGPSFPTTSRSDPVRSVGSSRMRRSPLISSSSYSDGYNGAPMATVSRSGKTFTPTQGQYLAYIHLYTRLHRRPPAETEMQDYFRVSPPSVHQMVLTLEQAGFIRRQPRTARSIELLVDPTQLPELP